MTDGSFECEMVVIGRVLKDVNTMKLSRFVQYNYRKRGYSEAIGPHRGFIFVDKALSEIISLLVVWSLDLFLWSIFMVPGLTCEIKIRTGGFG